MKHFLAMFALCTIAFLFGMVGVIIDKGLGGGMFGTFFGWIAAPLGLGAAHKGPVKLLMAHFIMVSSRYTISLG